MSRGLVLDPTASRDDNIADPGPEAGLLAGKRVGIRVDRIWRAWDWIAEDWAERMRAAGCEVSFWRSTDRSGAVGERQAAELAEWLTTIDVVVVGLANCGSCTGWTVRDAITAAATGIPTVAVATENFKEFAHEIAARGGRSGLRVHVLPYPLNEREQSEVMRVADDHFYALLDALGAKLEAQQDAA